MASFSPFPVLASLSMVAPVDAAEGDDATSQYPFFIENTFISVFDDSLESIEIRQRPRSHSAPPTCRSLSVTPLPKACSQEESMECIFCGRDSPYSMSSASTIAREDSEGGIASSEGSYDGDSSEENTNFASVSTLELDSVPSRATIHLTLSELLPPRTSLNSKAKAWSSSGLANVASQARLGFAEVVAAAKLSLSTCCIGPVQASENVGGMFLVGHIQGTECTNVKEALDLASEAMLAAAAQSENIYVIGYDRLPLKPLRKGFGFSAQLALVADETQACWDLLAKGVCHRGCACKWQHPAFQTSVTISLDVVPPVPV